MNGPRLGVVVVAVIVVVVIAIAVVIFVVIVVIVVAVVVVVIIVAVVVVVVAWRGNGRVCGRRGGWSSGRCVFQRDRRLRRVDWPWRPGGFGRAFRRGCVGRVGGSRSRRGG